MPDSDLPPEALELAISAFVRYGRIGGGVVTYSDGTVRGPLSDALTAALPAFRAWYEAGCDAAVKRAREREREACAQLAEDHGAVYVVADRPRAPLQRLPFADLIRARDTS